MKTNTIRNAAFAALIITAPSAAVFAADLTPFARMETSYTDSGYKGNLPKGYELGAAVTAGVFIAQQHELSLSTGYTKWEGDTFGTPGIALVSFDSEQIPLILNYRYHVSADNGFRFYAGPSIGLIYERATGTVIQNIGAPFVAGLKPVGSYHDDAFKFAYGGTVGASYVINDGWELNASAQVLRVSSEDYDSAGSAGKSPYEGATRIGFMLGLSYRW